MKQLLYILCAFLLISCWPTKFLSMNDDSMPEEWKSFYIENIELNSATAPSNYAANLAEDLRLGIQNNTKLKLENEIEKSDIQIAGSVTGYNTSPIAIQQGDEANQNRLTINVNYIIKTKTKGLENINFAASRFADYDANQNLIDVENELIKQINQQLVQDVVNKLLSNW